MNADQSGPIEVHLALLGKLEEAVRAMRKILEPATAEAALESERRLRATPRAFEDLDSLASQASDLHSWRIVREEVELRAAQARMAFGESLEKALTEAGIPWTGAFPSYTVRESIRLDIDPTRGTIRIGRRVVPLSSPNAIVRILAATRQSPARVSAEVDFEQELATAYADAAQAVGVSPGSHVSIGKIYDVLKRKMAKGYSRARFGEDLSVLLKKSNQYEFAAPRHPRQGIRVSIGDGVVVGSLRPRES